MRDYAKRLKSDAQKQPYLDLADEIDAIYQAAPLVSTLEDMAARYTAAPWLQQMLRQSAAALANEGSAGDRFIATGQLLADLRRALPRIRSSEVRLEVLDFSLRVEIENFSAASQLQTELPSATRLQQLAILRSAG